MQAAEEGERDKLLEKHRQKSEQERDAFTRRISLVRWDLGFILLVPVVALVRRGSLAGPWKGERREWQKF